MESAWFFKVFQDHVAKSPCLRILHLIGIRFNVTSYRALGTGLESSTVLKHFLFQNTNIAGGEYTTSCCTGSSAKSYVDYLHILTDYI